MTQNSWQDPQAQREAEKYENPIPSRELILEILSQHPKALSCEQLAGILGLYDDERQFALQRRLGAMVRDGQLASDRRGLFKPLDESECVQGYVQGHPDGFGFLIPEDKSPDILLTSKQMRLVFHGDIALVRVVGYDHKGRPEGRIVRVIERKTTHLVGRYCEEDGIAYVMPDNPRMTQEIVLQGDIKGAQLGQFIDVRIVEQPTHHSFAVGEVIEVLGDYLSAGLEIEIALRNFEIPHVWPVDVERQIVDMTPEVAEADKQGRVDLRDLALVTIDGEDAKDFDDAVYAEKRAGGGYRLVVAIADVSHYVTPYAPLDMEARQRTTSVYFPGFVVPMLPEILSNGLCSLKPQVDRLCMVCDMTLSRLGRVTSYRFYEAVMHSKARLTYTQVSALLEQPDSELGQQVSKTYPHLIQPLHNLYGLFKILRGTREKRGALDFDAPETYIIFDEQRKIDKILPRTRNQAHMLIEECMLAANVCAAEYVQKRQLPALYRNHEGPKDEKLIKLKSYLALLGIDFKAKKPTPADFQAVLLAIKDRPDAAIIETMLLRSMMQAVYSPENLGHFGLAYEAYAHFTSPIRRYPDLLLHRVIRHSLRHPDAPPAMDMTEMLALGEACSLNERRADEATRDVTAWLKCEYMQDHIGDVFTGVISAVTAFGFFVALDDIFVEGLVHVRHLAGDFFNFDPVLHQLIGSRTGESYAMGDKVEVRVAGVNLDERKMDFDFIAKLHSVKRRKVVSKTAPDTSKAKKSRNKKPDLRSDAEKSAAQAKKSQTNAKTKAKKPKSRRKSG
ncbi:ribonuclease R [Agitococcus lubricus]|uniref:Ribonuclease R n=1 Tax=Agitococcus lubricus TaxID=1077255 RepID=A0A2T5J321_9GAMM|nr:ribonuclease R [Agitococcus lubricus]PTQ90972.1 RNAse R [Agitococcus lubricus]